MFLLPLIFLPFVFVMAINRLVRIPVGLRRGELHVPARGRRRLAVAGAGAYLLLLGYTVGLVVVIAEGVLLTSDAVTALLHAAGYVAAYPLVYMVAAWVFYYAFRTR